MGAKYEFDKTRMEFRKVTHSVWTVLGKAVKYFLVTASLAVVYYVVFSFVINTDSERKLKRENQMYRQMYKSLSAREELVGDVLDGLRVKDNEIYHRLFNSDAPDLGSIYSDGLLSDVDTIPDGLIVEYSRVRLDTLSRISDRVEANFRRIMEALSDRKADLPPMTNPLAGFSYARTGASVGDRINPFYKVKVFHGGLDLISQQGESVVAAADGVVKEVTHSTKGLGNVVTIDHGNGYWTLYGHSQYMSVTQGQHVNKGDVLGIVGSTGYSTGDHLHFEVRLNGVAQNPSNYV